MKKLITKEEFLAKDDFYFEEIKKGKIFIYPTDTAYGIGCDFTNASSVKKIREIKNRDKRPFSVIVQGKDWIFENCEVSDRHKNSLDWLPGKFTFIFKIKNSSGFAKDALVGSGESLGVRIPDNWFSSWLVERELGFVTTSVNISGRKHMASMDDLDKDIMEKVDYIIYEGKLDNGLSKVIDLTGEKEKVLR